MTKIWDLDYLTVSVFESIIFSLPACRMSSHCPSLRKPSPRISTKLEKLIFNEPPQLLIVSA